ncbi:hypothetical protein TrVE_jg9797 [Triparma verrucosa]|uniref:Mitochondrial pyruvate carrier n=1 Tax=Triparma verrucosa TaxID=1606542 RepID=A0A9W7ELI3_9STRA|nr:hypothetical protein TrVE_jg9797 [Triparma verrucosa]
MPRSESFFNNAPLRRPPNPFFRPFTIHFWAPTFKWCITIANIADLARPVEKVSTPQQIAVTATGIIWSRYSFVITPVNYTLFSVNVFMAGSGIAQLKRKFDSGQW